MNQNEMMRMKIDLKGRRVPHAPGARGVKLSITLLTPDRRIWTESEDPLESEF